MLSGFQDQAQNQRLAVLLLCTLCALAFLPLFINPHWGLFSDPRQIVENCRAFWSSHDMRWDLVEGFHRPGFHVLDLLTWLFSKESPTGFYIFRWFVFSITVATTFIISSKLSRNFWISLLSAMCWFLLAPTFEVIYTLDKAEAYIALLFNTAIVSYQIGLQELCRSAPSKLRLRIAAVVMLLSCTYANFVKETGQLLTLSILVCPLSMWFFDAAMPKADSEKKAFRLWSFSLGASSVVSLLLFKAYIASGSSAVNATYGAMTYDLESIANHFALYYSFMPETFGLLLFCNIGLVRSILQRRQFQDALEAQSAALAASLTILATAGSVALMCWKYVIVYSWFPIDCLILPPTALYLTNLLKILPKKIAAPSLIIAAIIIFLLLAPTRFIQAQLQFNLDDSAKELTTALAERHASFKPDSLLGVPMLDPSSAELTEELESLTLSHLASNYIEPTMQESKDALKFFNFLNYEFPEQTKVPEQTLFLTSASNQHLHYLSDSDAVRSPGINLFSYWAKTTKADESKWSVTTYGSKATEADHWASRKLAVGDIFIIPFGDVPPSVASYRGTNLFCSDWKSKVAFLPQVKLQKLFTVQRKILQPIGKRFTAGWIVLEVLSAPRLSWFIDYPGNLRDKAKIFASHDLAGKMLNLNTQFSNKFIVLQEEPHRRLIVPAEATPENYVDLKVLLPQASANDLVQTTLRLEAPGANPENAYLIVRDASIVDAGN